VDEGFKLATEAKTRWETDCELLRDVGASKAEIRSRDEKGLPGVKALGVGSRTDSVFILPLSPHQYQLYPYILDTKNP
jgi:hypothetical protein